MDWLTRVIEALTEKAVEGLGFRVIAEIFGVNPDEVNEPSIKCAMTLRQGLTPEVCQDFRAIRRWVLCRAWDLLDTRQASTFREAVRTAWAEAKLGCAGKA